jgi:hypothetical protein
MERIAHQLGSELGLPVPATHLEDFDGEPASVQMKVYGRPWSQIKSEMPGNVTNADLWPLAALFDIWIANTDRNAGNFVFAPSPPGVAVAAATSFECWLIDHGQAGLWPGWKLAGAGGPMPIPDKVAMAASGQCASVTEAHIRTVMPSDYAQSLVGLDPDKRRAILDLVANVSDDAIKRAVDEVPGDYMTPGQADTLTGFLAARKHALRLIVATHWRV